MLKREQFWCLTIEFWRGDLEAGAKPTEGVTHRRHYFYFRHPPMREHFLEFAGSCPGQAFGTTRCSRFSPSTRGR